MTNRHSGISIFLLALCLFFTTLIGCANTVTDKIIEELLIRFEFQVQGTLDTANYQYFIIIATSNAQDLTPVVNQYFTAPGRIAESQDIIGAFGGTPTQEEAMVQFYETYFNFWRDFIILASGTKTGLFNSGFVGGFPTPTPTSDAFNLHDDFPLNRNTNATVSSVGNTYSITFPIAELTGFSENDQLFFMIIVTDIDSSLESGFIKDRLTIAQDITIFRTASETGTDANDAASDADIINWEVEVF